MHAHKHKRILNLCIHTCICVHSFICMHKYIYIFSLSEFLRRIFMIILIRGFRTVFIVILTKFQPMCPPAFCRCCLLNSGAYA